MDKCVGGLLSRFLEIFVTARAVSSDGRPCPRCAGRRSTWAVVAITTLTSQPVAAVQEFRPAFSWRNMNARVLGGGMPCLAIPTSAHFR